MTVPSAIHSRRRGVTLIELLIVVAILSIAFGGLHSLTVTSMEEARLGVEDATIRRQIQTARHALFRDIRNAAAAPEEWAGHASGAECLILTFPEGRVPAGVVYIRANDRLLRRVYTSEDASPAEAALVEFVDAVEFERRGGTVGWRIAAVARYQERTRRSETQSAALLAGGMTP